MRSWSPEQVALVLGGVTTVIAALATAVVKIIMALQGVANKVDQLEVKVDGRLSQLLERTALSSRAEGVVAGRVEMAESLGPAPPVPSSPDQLVVGIPVPTPPILLVPVEKKEPGEEP